MVLARHRIAGLAALATLLSGPPALAQSVHLFEEPPPLELLRSIMVPESRPGASRGLTPGQPGRPMPATAASPAPAAAPEAGPGAEAAPCGPLRPVSPGPVLTAAGSTLPLPAAARPVAKPPAADSIGFRINFALDSDVVPPSAFVFLDRVGELMREQPHLMLQVEGHTDALGSDAYNLVLSQRRAAAVAAYLQHQQGIDRARLVVLGLGEGMPLFANAYDPRNRRVQFARME
jgi:outer membrane protein OmpA-like peptidoglycan-associated protein